MKHEKRGKKKNIPHPSLGVIQRSPDTVGGGIIPSLVKRSVFRGKTIFSPHPLFPYIP
jgi:hypothetical protein